uniref:Uncharacterized protein n=1 Tax=Glossina brevipalpis TaxID=37001 RepID=A0A1A9WIT0_9MUSC
MTFNSSSAIRRRPDRNALQSFITRFLYISLFAALFRVIAIEAELSKITSCCCCCKYMHGALRVCVHSAAAAAADGGGGGGGGGVDNGSASTSLHSTSIKEPVFFLAFNGLLYDYSFLLKFATKKNIRSPLHLQLRDSQ